MSFTLLPEPAENALHDRRLLNFEERPFKRLKNRLLGPSSPITEYLSHSPNSLPTTTNDESALQTHKKTLENFKLHVNLDASSLKSHLARTQFLLRSNTLERERYGEQKERIETQCAAVRQRTADLRDRLEGARKTMEVRKGYDVLARAVMDDEKTKRSREELRRDRERLRVEIEELEREGDELRGAWVERRVWLGRVVDEARGMRGVIRGEAEGEGSADGEEGEEGERRRDEDELERNRNEGEGDGEGDGTSNVGTPAPGGDDGSATPLHPGSGEGVSGGMTPRTNVGDDGGATPRPDTSDGQVSGSRLKNEVGTDGANDHVGMEDSEETSQMQQPVPEVKVDDVSTNTVGDVEMT